MKVIIIDIINESDNYYLLRVNSGFGEELVYLPKRWNKKPRIGKIVCWEWLDHK